MEHSMIFPGLKKKSVKEIIFHILCTDYPLSLVKIHEIMVKKYNTKVSYQGIRFAVNELRQDDIVEKVGKEYLLNKEWVNSLVSFSEKLRDNYAQKGLFTRFDLQTTQVRVNNLSEMADFLLYGLENDLFDTSKAMDLYGQFIHLWVPYSTKGKRQRLKKCFMERKCYCLCEEKTFGDIILANYYKGWKIRMKAGVKLNLDADIWVLGDCVVHIYMPKKLRDHMKKIYSFSKDMFTSDKIDELSEMTFGKHIIDIIITRNPVIAKRIKEKVLSHF